MRGWLGPVRLAGASLGLADGWGIPEGNHLTTGRIGDRAEEFCITAPCALGQVAKLRILPHSPYALGLWRNVDPRALEVGDQPAVGHLFPVRGQPSQPAAVELLGAKPGV